jgi:hypothetical protein
MDGDKLKGLELEGWKEVVRSGEAEYQTAIRSQRLRRLLTSVWNSLPKDDRLQINDNLILVTDTSAMTIILDDNGAALDGLYGCAARVWNGRSFVYLSAARMKSKDDAFTAYVIAHELAHVFHRHGDKGTTRSAKKREVEADTLAARWGYPNPDPEENTKLSIRRGKKLPKGIRK